MTVKFTPEKDTKNTIRFKEAVGGPLDIPKIGTLYVSKQTLKELDYKEGQNLEVSLTIK